VVSSRLANIANPTSTEAMFVSSTGRRADVRRSTRGWPTLSSKGTQITSAATVTTNNEITASLPHPQLPPLEMPSNSAVSAIDNSAAPM